mgnify:CR=1 FL=1
MARDLIGTKLIAKSLSVSADTVARMIRAGELKAYKLRGNTSPWRVSREAIERIRRGQRAK